MLRLALLFATTLLAAGCSGEHQAPTAQGAWRPLAAGLWDVDPARVTVPPMPGE